MNNVIHRRTFLKRTSLAAGALAFSPLPRALGSQGDVRVAVVGCGGQGRYHIRCLRELPGVRIAAICDPDQTILDRLTKEFEDRQEAVQAFTDVRRLLEDQNIDAITTATPDHWHALVTIWACQAGKHVYVEKPLSHNIWEGRQMVEAARRYGRIVQFGNQSHGHPTGDMRLELEDLGRIRVAYTALNRLRQSIGKVEDVQVIPETIDYDLWTGPAPLEPLRRRKLHYDWHWVWPTGTGEIGNNGIYPLDACRLALGLNTLPRWALSLGGRFLFGDDGETPNAQLAFFQYDPGPLVIFELRNFPSEVGPQSIGSRVVCERGQAPLPRPLGTPGDTGGYSSHTGHLYNFLQAVRSGSADGLRADVLEGHLSTALVHMANISYRLGVPHHPKAALDIIKDKGSEATEAFERFREHLEANGVDLSKSELIVGPWLEMDPGREQFIGSSKLVHQANQLARGSYRAPFVVPEQV